MVIPDVNGENEKLIEDAESLQDSQSNIGEVLNSRNQVKLDAADEDKSAVKCESLINDILRNLSILKPKFPLHYKNGFMSFINCKIIGISIVTLALIGNFSSGYISEIGKITLVQTYVQKWMILEDLTE